MKKVLSINPRYELEGAKVREEKWRGDYSSLGLSLQGQEPGAWNGMKRWNEKNPLERCKDIYFWYRLRKFSCYFLIRKGNGPQTTPKLFSGLTNQQKRKQIICSENLVSSSAGLLAPLTPDAGKCTYPLQKPRYNSGNSQRIPLDKVPKTMVKNKKSTQETRYQAQREKKTTGPQRFQLLELSNMDYDSVQSV